MMCFWEFWAFFEKTVKRLGIGLSGNDLPPSLFGLFPKFDRLFFVKTSLIALGRLCWRYWPIFRQPAISGIVIGHIQHVLLAHSPHCTLRSFYFGALYFEIAILSKLQTFNKMSLGCIITWGYINSSTVLASIRGVVYVWLVRANIASFWCLPFTKNVLKSCSP